LSKRWRQKKIMMIFLTPKMRVNKLTLGQLLQAKKSMKSLRKRKRKVQQMSFNNAKDSRLMKIKLK